MTPPIHRYRIHGLEVASDIELRDLAPGVSQSPDVVIRRTMADTRTNVDDIGPTGYVSDGRGLRIDIRRLARFLVNSDEIVVQVAPGASPSAVRDLLLGRCLAALLHPRGIWPLHASTVSVNGQAVIFAAGTGLGKSTLAAHFEESGYAVVADDVTGIYRGADDMPYTYPGRRTMRLAPKAAARVGWTTGLDAQHKATYRARDVADSQPLRVRRLYRLAFGDGETRISGPVRGQEKFLLLVLGTYKRRMLSRIGFQPSHLAVQAAVARHVAVRRLWRPRSGVDPDLLVKLVERDLCSESAEQVV